MIIQKIIRSVLEKCEKVVIMSALKTQFLFQFDRFKKLFSVG